MQLHKENIMEKYEFRRDEFEWAEEFYELIRKPMMTHTL